MSPTIENNHLFLSCIFHAIRNPDSVLGGEYQRYMKDEQKTEVPVSNSAFASTDFVSLSAPVRRVSGRVAGRADVDKLCRVM